jgi:hypothetical protein
VSDLASGSKRLRLGRSTLMAGDLRYLPKVLVIRNANCELTSLDVLVIVVKIQEKWAILSLFMTTDL